MIRFVFIVLNHSVLFLILIVLRDIDKNDSHDLGQPLMMIEDSYSCL